MLYQEHKSSSQHSLIIETVSQTSPYHISVHTIGEYICSFVKSGCMYKYQSLNHEHLIFNLLCGMLKGLMSSDEESSDSEDDMLPWQPEWFTASSDEDQMDDEDDE